MTEVIGPALVITLDAGERVISDGGVAVDGDRIAAVGDYRELLAAYPDATVFPAEGRVLMPGLINAHAHFYGTFARGMALKDPPPETFREVLERIWWRLDKALDRKAVYLSALLGGIAALRAGCTTLFDHHASPNAIEGSLDEVAGAMGTVGLRACLCYEVSDRDGADKAAAGIAENVRFARTVRPGGRLAAKFGLHASFTLGPETLQQARQAEADLGVGFHIHCAEGPEDGADSWARYNRSVVQRLTDEAILGPNSIVAHCVHVTNREMRLLAESGATVTHQPHSNMGNAVGWAALAQMGARGIRTALGTDGYTWDLLETMRTASALHAHETGRPGDGVTEMAKALLYGNAELASRTFGRKLGVLEPGAAADMVLLDYFPPTPLTAVNLPWHMQFGMAAPQVHSVWVDGRKVLVNRLLTAVLSEESLAREARGVAAAVWERF